MVNWLIPQALSLRNPPPNLVTCEDLLLLRLLLFLLCIYKCLLSFSFLCFLVTFLLKSKRNQIVILLCYRGIKALFCTRRLKTKHPPLLTKKGLGFCWSTFYNVVFTIDTQLSTLINMYVELSHSCQLYNFITRI